MSSSDNDQAWPLNTDCTPTKLEVHIKLNIKYFNELLGKDLDNQKPILTEEDKEKIKEAYEKSHHIREYEINLFWSRLNYFWAITAVLFTGWGVILNSIITPEKDHVVSEWQYATLFSISIFGIALTMLSGQITLAGKHWQQVWEYHLTNLEPFQSGNLYSMKFKNNDKTPPSITSVVNIFHYFLAAIWFISSILSAIIPFRSYSNSFVIIEIIVIVIVYCLCWWIVKAASTPSRNNLKLI